MRIPERTARFMKAAGNGGGKHEIHFLYFEKPEEPEIQGTGKNIF